MLRIALTLVAALLVVLLGRFVYLSMTTQPPESLAVHHLTPCPEKPNCVSSLAESRSQRVEPLLIPGSADAALSHMVRAIETLPRSHIVTAADGYLHAEFTSFLFRFVDDLELVYEPGLPGFHVRSASRSGHSDLGVNRKRIEALRALVSLDLPRLPRE